jgi:hypothetical protein
VKLRLSLTPRFIEVLKSLRGRQLFQQFWFPSKTVETVTRGVRHARHSTEVGC